MPERLSRGQRRGGALQATRSETRCDDAGGTRRNLKGGATALFPRAGSTPRADDANRAPLGASLRSRDSFDHDCGSASRTSRPCRGSTAILIPSSTLSSSHPLAWSQRAAWPRELTSHTTDWIASSLPSMSLRAGPSPSDQRPWASGLAGSRNRCHWCRSACRSRAVTMTSRVLSSPSGPPPRRSSSCAVTARASAARNDLKLHRNTNGRTDPSRAIRTPPDLPLARRPRSRPSDPAPNASPRRGQRDNSCAEP